MQIFIKFSIRWINTDFTDLLKIKREVFLKRTDALGNISFDSNIKDILSVRANITDVLFIPFYHRESETMWCHGTNLRDGSIVANTDMYVTVCYLE